MALPVWLERASQGSSIDVEKIPYDRSRKFFAVDASASTMGSRMRAEKDVVLRMHTDSNDAVCKWGKPPMTL